VATHAGTHPRATAWLPSTGTILVFHRLFNHEDYREGELFALYQVLRARPDLAVEVIGTSTRVIVTDPTKMRSHPHRPGKGIFGLPQSAALRIASISTQQSSKALPPQAQARG